MRRTLCDCDKCKISWQRLAPSAAIDVPPLADDYDGMDAPACGHSLVGARELTEWFVREGWRTSKQEIVERLLKDYDVVRKA